MKTRLTFKIGDREVPVKSDSEDSDDEYDSNWSLVLMSKRTYRKYQTQSTNSKLDRDGSFLDSGHQFRSGEVGGSERQHPPSVIKVTHYVPKIDKTANRERSVRALERTRERIAERSGRPSRLVMDRSTGLLLSRDTVDSSIYSGGEGVGESSKGGGFHYRSSVEALQRLRDLRLMRRMDEVLDDQ